MLVSRSGLMPIRTGKANTPTKTATIPIPLIHVFKISVYIHQNGARHLPANVPIQRRARTLIEHAGCASAGIGSYVRRHLRPTLSFSYPSFRYLLIFSICPEYVLWRT